MLTINDLNLDCKLSIGIALSFSSEVLHLYEAKYPTDLRPRKAIDSVIRWLDNPCPKTRSAAVSAADASSAAGVAYAAYAAYAAYYAAAAHAAPTAFAARYAARAANAAHAAFAARYAARAANAAHAAYAAHAARITNVANKDKYIHDRIVKILPLILEYKIENKQSFNNAEKVLEYLKDEDKVSFLFNLNILR